MTHSKLNLIYNLGDQGWTETFYRTSATVEAAAQLDAAFLRATMRLRTDGVLLEASRSQEEGGLRPHFLDLARVRGLAPGLPHTTAICAHCRIDFAGGGSRPLHVRGIPFDWVKYDKQGRGRPPQRFLDLLGEWFGHAQRVGLAGRMRRREEPWHNVTRLSESEEYPSLVRVSVGDDFQPAQGEFVYFGQAGQLAVRAEKPYWVYASSPGEVTLFETWPGTRDEPTSNLRMKRLAFDYPAFEQIRFSHFGTYKPGAKYRPASWQEVQPGRVPFSPCQRIVDYLRRCYTTRMRFRADDLEAAEKIRWFFLDFHLERKYRPPAIVDGPALKVIPFATPFGSRNWLVDEWPEIPVGETWERRNSHGVQTSVLTGEGLAGAESVWRTGATGGLPALRYSPSTGWP